MSGDVEVLLINFFNTFGDGLSRRKEHRPEDALFRLNTMRRRAVNILRRTCGRNADNLFAASCRRTSASAISRFTRLLSCPCGRLSRHLFGFFFLFFFPVEKSMFLFLFRLFSRSALGLGLWFFCG